MVWWALNLLRRLRPAAGSNVRFVLMVVGGALVLPWVLALYLLWLRLAFTKLGGLEFLAPIR